MAPVKIHITTKNILFIIFLFSFSTLQAQQGSQKLSTAPAFKINPVVLQIPAFLPGIMKDPTATLTNDTLTYNLEGQLFENGFKIIPGKGAAALSTPWETIVEMADAYSKKDPKRIVALYSAGSKQKIKNILSGNQRNSFLEFVSNAAKANLRILGGMQYQNGFMAYTKDDIYGLHENFIIKENNKYKLAALDDKQTGSWNMGLFFKFDPKPMIPVKNISRPDSIEMDDSVSVKITLPETGRWVILYLDKPGEPTRLRIQDNGIGDNDPAEKQVMFYLDGRRFIGPGIYNFYISSFNFPVQRVSPNFITDEAKYSIKIYKVEK